MHAAKKKSTCLSAIFKIGCKRGVKLLNYKSVSCSLKQSIILEFQLKDMTGKNNYIESTNQIYMESMIFHLIISIASTKKHAIIQVGKRITSPHE